MKDQLKVHLSQLLDKPIRTLLPVSGGDISEAYRIETADNTYFLKCNSSPRALHMFEMEANGLQIINNTKTIKTPEVLHYGTFENAAFLLLEYIESKSASAEDFARLGSQLAKLHHCTADTFGLALDNYIGSLAQRNTPHEQWIQFYLHERLLPQIHMATQQGLLDLKECPSIGTLTNTLESLMPSVKPSLLHGDLWSGNYIISKEGVPYLIDPAAYYGHHEVDLAMTRLFGGFGQSFYEAYQAVHPKDTQTASRIDIYQLYYLLVHLNLFGSSYRASVVSIFRKYF
ncbi:fructosamine kinase family protein [Aestuariivivens sediminicola]|uniref:fructosamine kinase family protein n=1 Tax=Aestuariivivens sediminicola TaxID=2913560 RepID=UPI001F562709